MEREYAGDTLEDRRLWNTYFYWARTRAKIKDERNKINPDLLIENAQNRVEESLAEALHSILFSCFALEYRLKRVLIDFFGINLEKPKRVGLSEIIEKFWDYLKDKKKHKSQEVCAPPNISEWKACQKLLKLLVNHRNKIVHGNYNQVQGIFQKRSEPFIEAQQYYNAVVDAIKMVNIGTGYDKPTLETDRVFEMLKVRGSEKSSIRNEA